MSIATPHFSILMPTRNRAHLLPFALQSALDQTFHDFEIVLSNNSSSDDTERVALEFAALDPRIKYFRTQSSLSMHESWEFALSHARGEWVTLLGDDDAVSARMLDQANKAIERFPTEVVSWRTQNYWGADNPPDTRNRYVMHRFSGESRTISSEDALRNLFGFRSDNTPPRMFNSCCNRAVIRRVQEKVGHFFLPTAPDFTSLVATLAAVDSYIYIDLPLLLAGSGGGSPHESQSDYERYLDELGVANRAVYAPIPMMSPCNAVVEPLFKMKHLLAPALNSIPVDLEGYIAIFHRLILDHEAKGFKLRRERDALAEFIRNQPRDVQNRVQRRLALITWRDRIERPLRRAGSRTAVVNNLNRWTKLINYRGDREGFDNILGAVRHLDATCFAGGKIASTV